MTHLAHSSEVTCIEFWPIDVPISDPFVVATGSRIMAENVYVRLHLASGVIGYGEAAPFPEVGGEDRRSCLAALTQLSPLLIGHAAHHITSAAERMMELAPSQPAARCALETALWDAYCRTLGYPMWQQWGGTDVRSRETDITIPISTLERTVELARRWYEKGFRIFKMKVGKEVEHDILRLKAVHTVFPDVMFIGDGNQGFSVADCLTFVTGVQQFGGRLILLEQPVVREDLDGLAAIRRASAIPVAADESVRSLDDAKRVVQHEAADYINIKIMKTGVCQAIDIASFALRSGLKLMIGGMIESRVAMGCSFSLVLGMRGFEILDLDTPLLLAADPVSGGYDYQGPHLQPWATAGLGLSVVPPNEGRTIIR